MGPFTLSDDCVDFIDNGSQSCGPFEDSLGFFEIDLSASTEYDSGSDEIEATDIAVSINGPCTIELSGTYTLSNAGNDSWVTAGDPIGEYSLDSCTPSEELVITGNLGPSPSSGTFDAVWNVNVS